MSPIYSSLFLWKFHMCWKPTKRHFSFRFFLSFFFLIQNNHLISRKRKGEEKKGERNQLCDIGIPQGIINESIDRQTHLFSFFFLSLLIHVMSVYMLTASSFTLKCFGHCVIYIVNDKSGINFSPCSVSWKFMYLNYWYSCRITVF